MALQQGLVTITGRVGSAPQGFGHSSPPTICTFRLACTRGYYDMNRQWKTTPTTWITVKTYRALAGNVLSSVRLGQPVIATGVLATEEWATETGEKRTRIVLEASNVGHDLNYGTTHLAQPSRSAGATADANTDGGAADALSAGGGVAGANAGVDAGEAGMPSASSPVDQVAAAGPGNDPFANAQQGVTNDVPGSADQPPLAAVSVASPPTDTPPSVTTQPSQEEFSAPEF